MADAGESFYPDKMVGMWAKRYILLYQEEGPDRAKEWAMRFLDGPSRSAMIERVNKLIHKEKKDNGRV